MSKIPIALLLDNGHIASWQKEALEHAADLIEIKLIINCTNTKNPRKLVQHFGYYLVNYFALRNKSTNKRLFHGGEVKTIHFKSSYQGSWQSIPSEVYTEILALDINVIVKFGMSLLTIDSEAKPFDILSFHHGDPSCYRGRPAGFYEIYDNAESVGIIVQKLSNTLDGGNILSQGFSKIFPHSYKKTSINFFSNSKYLLRLAFVNYSLGKTSSCDSLGKNYTLPSNFRVLKFVFMLAQRKCIRFCYGIFYEKKWNIQKIAINPNHLIPSNLSIKYGLIPEISKKYIFYADPFFSTDGLKIRLEALSKKTGLGDVIELDVDSLAVVNTLFTGEHYSFPCSYQEKDDEFLIPEVGSFASPFLFNLATQQLTQIEFEGTSPHVVDATIFKQDGTYFLFCSMVNSSLDNLHLFWSKNLFGSYKSHPLNPVVMSPRFARMAGKILIHNNNFYRFGQNNCYGYGDKISVMKISDITTETYHEDFYSEISYTDSKGPHTIDFHHDCLVTDFYEDRFALLAGARRLLAVSKKFFN